MKPMNARFGSAMVLGVASVLWLSACGSSAASRETAITALTGDMTSGRTLYLDQCVTCHGDDGRSGTAGENITGEIESEGVLTIIEGEGEMPGFSDLSDQQLSDILAYIKTL